MAKQLFGTDGIRGVAGEYPLDPAGVFAFGLALGRDLTGEIESPEVLIGMDTRESGPWIAGLVAGGLAACGVRVRFAGVITTPGVAHLTRTGPFLAGVMISASHNAYQDNGLKVFGHTGFKLPDLEEQAIEHEILRLREQALTPVPAELEIDETLDATYVDFLASTVGQASPPADVGQAFSPANRPLDSLSSPSRLPFQGIRLVTDCGNGASYRIAPDLFRRLGAEVTSICTAPNGRNINQGCGALHLEPLRAAVLEQHTDFGVAFDGDADRAIFVARSGKIVDGDGILLIAARALAYQRRLAQNTVVSTVMSNLGLEKALEREGIRMVRTPVGDKYVLEEMVRLGAVLGGEQSGHVIFREFATTGDGVLTALRVFETARCAGAGLDELTADFQVYPQRLVNVRVREKKQLTEIPAVAHEIHQAEEEFAGSGRILVRFSGTEPLARVMVEGADLTLVERHSHNIAEAIRREMGA